MRKSVFEFVGLFILGFIVVSLLGFSITGFQTAGTSSSSESNFGNATPGVGGSSEPPLSAPDPNIDQIVNGGDSSDSDFDTTETDALEGFNFLSIEEYNSQNLSRFPWIPVLIFFVFMVIVVLMILFFFVFSKHQSRSVVRVQKPFVPAITSSSEPLLDPSLQVKSGSGLPLKATQSSESSSINSSQNTVSSSTQASLPTKTTPVQQDSSLQQVTQHNQQSLDVSSSQVQPVQAKPITSVPTQSQSSVTQQPSSQQQQQQQQQSSQSQFVSQPSFDDSGTLSENLRYIKYYSHNMSKNPKVRIDYLIGQGKDFLRKGDVMSAKQIYAFISEEYKHLEVHDDAVYNAIVEFSARLK